QFDRRTRDCRLQVASVVVLGVPGTRGLVEAPEPDYGVRYNLHADLKALQVVLFVAQLVLAEQSEPAPIDREHGIANRVGVFVELVRRSRTAEAMALGTGKQHEFARRVPI